VGDRPRPGRNERSADPAEARSLGHVRAATEVEGRVALLWEVVADRGDRAWDHID
jgi:hypothetical protein